MAAALATHIQPAAAQEASLPTVEAAPITEPSPITPPPDRTRGSRVIEEITVTAQKREELAIDVPISMSVVTGDFMKDAGVTDLQDMSKFTTNTRFNIDYSAGGGNFGNGPNIRIRGFGTSPGGDLFDQPVGFAIDGDSYSKLAPFIGGLFDIQRVEVLKGPQGTLFGKNTTAGLINVSTREPSDEFTGGLVAEAGSYESRRYEGTFGGPLISSVVNFRVAGFLDRRNGWMRNTAVSRFPDADRVLGGKDRHGLRYKLDFPDLLGSHLNIYQEHSRSEALGVVADHILTDPGQAMANWFREYDPDVEFVKGNRKGSVDAPTRYTVESRRMVANGSREFGDWSLFVLFGDSHARTKFHGGSLNAPIPFSPIAQGNNAIDQETLELRLQSSELPGFLGQQDMFGVPLGSSEVTVGLFHQRNSGSQEQAASIAAVPLAELLAITQTEFYPPVPAGSGIINPAYSRFNTDAADHGKQYSAFMQIKWHFSERWTFEPGVRYTYESKDSSSNNTYPDPVSEALFAVALGFPNEPMSGVASFNAVTPRATLSYSAATDLNLFGSWSKGFKSGGLNLDPTADQRIFKPEKATSWEVGMKSRLLDRTLSVDLSFFWTDVLDLQIQSFIPRTVSGTQISLPTGAQYIHNAGKARSRGFDLDITWLPADWMTVVGGAGLSDTKYLDYRLAPCARTNDDRQDPETGHCDLTGLAFEFTPKWQATITPQVRFPVGVAALEFFLSASGHYESESNVNSTLFADAHQPGFFTLDAKLGIADPVRGWSLYVSGTNLTDTYVATGSFSITKPTLHTVLFPAPPRMISAGFRYEF